jgi:hypothetical protein
MKRKGNAKGICRAIDAHWQFSICMGNAKVEDSLDLGTARSGDGSGCHARASLFGRGIGETGLPGRGLCEGTQVGVNVGGDVGHGVRS